MRWQTAFDGLAGWLDYALPPVCLLCGERAAPADPLCQACRQRLPAAPQPACARCAAPLGQAAAACGACLVRPPAFDASIAAWRYAAPIDTLIQQLKFGHAAHAPAGARNDRRFASADFFAAGLAAALRQHADAQTRAATRRIDLLLPVPLSADRLRERGFNQALEIARPLARALALPLDACRLVRTRATPAQSRLPWRQRHANVHDAFACTRDLHGLQVLVVDDVMTTGATLEAVARTLKQCGASWVGNAVVARAVRHESGAT